MPDESTSPDLVELTREAVAAGSSRDPRELDIHEAGAAAERHAQERG